jgi:hypothetical protein
MLPSEAVASAAYSEITAPTTSGKRREIPHYIRPLTELSNIFR